MASETTQALPVIPAQTLLRHLCGCPGMLEHFQAQGAAPEDLALVQGLLGDNTLVFFSVQRVIDRQVYKTKKAQEYIPDDNKDKVLECIGTAL